jgi:transposase
VHAEEEQLLAPHPAQVPLLDATAPQGTGLEPGLQPAQPAAALLDGAGPAAGGRHRARATGQRSSTIGTGARAGHPRQSTRRSWWPACPAGSAPPSRRWQRPPVPAPGRHWPSTRPWRGRGGLIVLALGGALDLVGLGDVDTFGLLLVVWVTAASVQDRDAARALLWRLRASYRSIRLCWADAGNAGKLVAWAAELLHLVVEIVRKRPGQSTFQVLPRRWVVERISAWISKYRRCVRDYERLPAHHAAMVTWAMVAVMTRRLARPHRPSSVRTNVA